MGHARYKAARRGLPAAVAVGALAVALGAGPSGAQTPAEPAEIVMKIDGRSLDFKGSKQVVAGEQLRIRNATNPRRIGPHTFTLVTARLLPKPRSFKGCFGRGRICRRVAVAHRVNFKTEKVGRPLFKTGKEGWDKSFTRNRTSTGDTWFTARKSETISQVVSAKAGTTLRYMCAIHPEMQGRIDVVQGATPPAP